MIRFLGKLSVFALIPIMGVLLFVWVTPANIYTYRSWEALSPHFADFGGSFYPDQQLHTVEVGDLAVRTEYAVPKDVEFVTDSYGERYAGPPLDQFDIIVAGDSNVVGSSLTQADTIAAVLAERTGLTVYPFHGSLSKLLATPRLVNFKPQLIILVEIERDLSSGLCPTMLPDQWPDVKTVPPPVSYAALRIYVDRLSRQAGYLTMYLRAIHTVRSLIVNKSTGMVFFEDALVSPDPSSSYVQSVVDAVQHCSHWIEAQGVEFVFMPIPDRENVYFDMIPDASRPALDVPRDQFLKEVIAGTQAERIRVIDLLTVYNAARREGINPYQLDDTHWGPAGVDLAAAQIMAEIDCNQPGCGGGSAGD